jgi:hypothetical protein
MEKEYKALIDQLEDITIENTRLKKLALEAEANLVEMEKLNSINDELLLEIAQLKSRVKFNLR